MASDIGLSGSGLGSQRFQRVIGAAPKQILTRFQTSTGRCQQNRSHSWNGLHFCFERQPQFQIQPFLQTQFINVEIIGGFAPLFLRPQPTRINQIDRVVRHISVHVQPVAIPDGVNSQKPPQRRAVVPRAVMVESGFRIPPLAGVAQRVVAVRGYCISLCGPDQTVFVVIVIRPLTAIAG